MDEMSQTRFGKSIPTSKKELIWPDLKVQFDFGLLEKTKVGRQVYLN